MDYDGLIPKFKFNRHLNRDEIDNQLKQKEKLELDGQSLVSDNKIISFSSHRLELVDKFYQFKGVLAFVGIVFFTLLLFLFLFLLYFVLFVYGWNYIGHTYPYVIFLFPVFGMSLFCFNILKKECFSWTHYPIIFDRKNRQVHYFRMDGSAHSVQWERVFFTTGLYYRKEFNKNDYYISGHILSEDNQAVIDTFCLPATHSDRKQLERHWEFVRRYMEEGPASVAHEVKLCLPITGKREGYQFGLLYLLSAFNGAPLFLFPLLFVLAFIFSIPRYIAMVTSKVPVWPQYIEDLCVVEEGDPYARDASHNPKHPWRDFFRHFDE